MAVYTERRKPLVVASQSRGGLGCLAADIRTYPASRPRGRVELADAVAKPVDLAPRWTTPETSWKLSLRPKRYSSDALPPRS